MTISTTAMSSQKIEYKKQDQIRLDIRNYKMEVKIMSNVLWRGGGGNHKNLIEYQSLLWMPNLSRRVMKFHNNLQVLNVFRHI